MSDKIKIELELNDVYSLQYLFEEYYEIVEKFLGKSCCPRICEALNESLINNKSDK